MSRHKKLRPKLNHNPASPLPPRLTHSQAQQSQCDQLAEVKRQVKALSLRRGLDNTERMVLNLIAHRITIGLVLSDGDYACMARLWDKHGEQS